MNKKKLNAIKRKQEKIRYLNEAKKALKRMYFATTKEELEDAFSFYKKAMNAFEISKICPLAAYRVFNDIYL